jgi:hypothetical protein
LGGVDGEEGAARGEGERLHISHDTLEDAAAEAVCCGSEAGV